MKEVKNLIKRQPFFSTENGQLYCGGCLEVMDYLIKEGIKVDAIITDPPYETTGHSWDKIIPFDAMWERLLKLIKDDGAIVLFGNEPFSSNLRKSNEKLYRYDWKWLKTQVTGFQSSKYQPLRCYEDIMVFSKAGVVNNASKKMKYYPQGLIKVNLKVQKKPITYLKDKSKKNMVENQKITRENTNFPRNVIQFPRESNIVHPTQKPINLMEYLICTYTKENEVVLDFTSGSGSTLIACEISKRKWIGIEKSEDFCNVIKERMKKGIQIKMLLEY